MPAISYSYTFDTGSQGLTPNLYDNGTGWVSTAGNPPGCLEYNYTDIGGVDSAWVSSALLGTWEDFGVPVGATVQSVQLTRVDYQNPGASAQVVVEVDLLSSGVSVFGAPLWSSPELVPTLGWVQLTALADIGVDAAYQQSATPVQFRLMWTVGSAGTGTIYVDNVILTIVYTTGESEQLERATVYEGAQLGIETVPGTAVAATRRLLNVEIDPQPKTDIKPVRPMGFKAATGVVTGKEYTDAKLAGDLAYNDIVYLFSSLLSNAAAPATPASVYTLTLGVQTSGTFELTFNTKNTAAIQWNATAGAIQTALEALSSVGVGNVWVTGTGPFTIQFQFGLGATAQALTAIFTSLGTPANASLVAVAPTQTKRWEFLPNYNQPDQYQTYTIEKGALGSANGGSQIAYGVLSQLGFKISGSAASVDGSWLGQPIVDPFTLTTSGVTEIASLPVSPTQVAVYLGSSTSTMVRLTRCIEMDLSMSARFKPVLTLDNSTNGFSALVEDAPQPKFKLTVEHDSEATTILAAMRAGSVQYLRFECVGPSIETGFNNRICIMAPVRVIQAPRADKGGIYVSEFEAEICYDPTLGGWIRAECDNILTTL